MRGASVQVALLVLLLVAGAADAYHGKPGRAGVLASGPVALEGDVLAAAQPATALYGSDGRLSMRLLEGQVEAVVTEVRVRGGPLAAILPPPEPVETRFAADAPRLTLAVVGHDMDLAVFTHEAPAQFTYGTDAARLVHAPAGRVVPSDAARPGIREAERQGEVFSVHAPRAEVALAAARGELAAVGTFRLYVFDATLVVGDQTVRTGTWSDGSDRVVRWAILEFRDAHLRVADDGALRAFRTPVLDVRLNGTATFDVAQGSAAVDSADPNLVGDVALLSGVLDLTAAPTDHGLRLDATGDFVAATFGGQPTSFLAPAATVGLAAAVLAALVFAWPAIKTSGAAALYARFAGPAVLDHAGRDRALDHVRRNPGASVKEVADGIGVSWSTAAYHLEVLAREGFLARHRAGRHRRYFATGDAVDRAAVSILHDGTARRLAELVRDRPGLSQKELAGLVGISPSTASWQLRRLVEAGVLEEERAWRRVSYRPGRGVRA